jgi:hypothetical protein
MCISGAAAKFARQQIENIEKFIGKVFDYRPVSWISYAEKFSDPWNTLTEQRNVHHRKTKHARKRA